MNHDLVDLIREKIGERESERVYRIMVNSTFLDRRVTQDKGIISLKDLYAGHENLFRINYDIVQRNKLQDKHFLRIEKIKHRVEDYQTFS